MCATFVGSMRCVVKHVDEITETSSLFRGNVSFAKDNSYQQRIFIHMSVLIGNF